MSRKKDPAAVGAATGETASERIPQNQFHYITGCQELQGRRRRNGQTIGLICHDSSEGAV